MMIRGLKFLTLGLLLGTIFGICLAIEGCQSNEIVQNDLDLEQYSNFTFLKDLSRDNFKDNDIKQVMDLSVDIKQLLNEKQYDKVKDLLWEYVKAHPMDLSMKYELAYLLYVNKDYKASLDLSLDILEQKDKSFYTMSESKFRLLYAELLVQNLDYSKADDELKNLISKTPSSRAYVCLAKLYIKKHKYDAAKYILTKAEDFYLTYESDPVDYKYQDSFKAFSDDQVLDRLSNIYFWKTYLNIYERDFNVAQQNIKYIDKKYSSNSDVMYLYGLYYYSIGNFDEAKLQLSSLNLVDPSFRGYYLESKIFEASGDYQRQKLCLVTALKYKTDPQAQLDLARLYYSQLGEYSKAYLLASQVKQTGSLEQKRQASGILLNLDKK